MAGVIVNGLGLRSGRSESSFRHCSPTRLSMSDQTCHSSAEWREIPTCSRSVVLFIFAVMVCPVEAWSTVAGQAVQIQLVCLVSRPSQSRTVERTAPGRQREGRSGHEVLRPRRHHHHPGPEQRTKPRQHHNSLMNKDATEASTFINTPKAQKRGTHHVLSDPMQLWVRSLPAAVPPRIEASFPFRSDRRQRREQHHFSRSPCRSLSLCPSSSFSSSSLVNTTSLYDIRHHTPKYFLDHDARKGETHSDASNTTNRDYSVQHSHTGNRLTHNQPNNTRRAHTTGNEEMVVVVVSNTLLWSVSFFLLPCSMQRAVPQVLRSVRASSSWTAAGLQPACGVTYEVPDAYV